MASGRVPNTVNIRKICHPRPATEHSLAAHQNRRLNGDERSLYAARAAQMALDWFICVEFSMLFRRKEELD
jgi:hypothetical protein